MFQAKIKDPVGVAVAPEGFEISEPDVDEGEDSMSVDQGEQHRYHPRLVE